ncbi:hypothetical protein [Amycolatopsis saalfeldensis]|uniref:hypothetical protein n=1 Tax=Amycolatopsis saalfeldensis TaxID=394193 RepID=UPI001FE603A5|nr:hypothetical protein [Amycolatopsis saalfeldensis]
MNPVRRSRWMAGSATLTTLTSSIAMKLPRNTATISMGLPATVFVGITRAASLLNSA